MNYFKQIETLEELRNQYKQLLKKYHPDNATGSTEATQEINAEYDLLFNQLRNTHFQKASKEQHTENGFNNMKYDFNEDERLREVLQKIIILSTASIEIIGSWIWVECESREYNNYLKELGFKWASKKKQWYFHTESFRKKSNRTLSMVEIRNLYGSTKITTKQKELLEV